MKMKYDDDVDALYIVLRNDKNKDKDIDGTVPVHPNILLDLTEDGEVVGIEILYLKDLLLTLLKK